MFDSLRGTQIASPVVGRGSELASPTSAIHYTERLGKAGAVTSVGSRGDSYDNALAETVIGLYKTELVRRAGPWKGIDNVEFGTLEWVDWFNHTVSWSRSMKWLHDSRTKVTRRRGLESRSMARVSLIYSYDEPATKVVELSPDLETHTLVKRAGDGLPQELASNATAEIHTMPSCALTRSSPPSNVRRLQTERHSRRTPLTPIPPSR